MHFLFHNGQSQRENIPVFHAWNRSFRYGDGLFESIATGKNNIPFLDTHWERITAGADMLSLELPQDFTKSSLQKSIAELRSLNGINENAFVRLMLFREGSGKYQPAEMQAGWLLEAEPLPGKLFELNPKGLSIGLFTDAVKPTDRLSNFKTNSALIYVLASVYASKSGWDDCALLNARSGICESTNSNIFFVKGKKILTPSLHDGCVDGVMRKQVIRIARENGFTVDETAINIDLLSEADEVFLTNAVRGIRWVGEYGEIKYVNSMSSALSGLLQAAVST